MSHPLHSLKAHVISDLQRLSKRIESLETQLHDERRHLESLIDTLKTLTAGDTSSETVASPHAEQRPYVDRRSLPNTEKNLKISARRSFAWSYGMDKQEAHTRAMAAVERRAKALGLNAVPKGVVEYVDEIAKQFGLIKTKNPRRALSAPAR